MYLKQSFRKETGRTYLVIAQKYRDPRKNKSTDKTIKSLGYVDELEKIYPDPIAHFRKVAKEMTIHDDLENKISLVLDMNEQLKPDEDNGKNFGYAAILKIYHELEIHKFINNRARNEEFKYNTNSIMTLLVTQRLLYPGSKKKAYADRELYFERFSFSLADVYRSLSHFAKISQEFQRYLNKQIADKYGRNTEVIYYDVTNYYFEIDKADALRKYGKEKNGRHDPIVQMGLAMDTDGIPLHYELFPGNKLDKETFRSVIGEVRKNYDTDRIIVVADMGIITGDNIYYLTEGRNKNGYVLSFSVRGGNEKFKNYVLDEEGYTAANGKPLKDGYEFKIKSRRIAREINVTMTDGRTAKKTVYEKQVIFWNKKYADKARTQRHETIEKAMEIVADPKQYNRATGYGAAKYVRNLQIDKESGEVIESKAFPYLDGEKIEREERFDGYYAIVTSELYMSDARIISTYRGLWEIEETFKITKSTLEARPVYVSREDRINAHFLTCFITLTILRLLQRRLKYKYSHEQIVDCLRKISCLYEQDNIYLFKYRSEISDAIGDALGLDFTKKRLRLGEIKNILANSKK